MKKEHQEKINIMTSDVRESKDNSIIENIKNSGNTIAFNLKFVFSNHRLMTTIALFYVIAILMSVIFIPFWISGAMLQLVAIIVPTLIILGVTGSGVKKSTLYKNISISGIRRRTFYLAQLITTIIVVNVLSIILWSLIWFLGHFDMFLAGWIWENGGYLNPNPLVHGTPLLIFYSTMLTAGVIFATYFLMDALTSAEKTYNLVVVSLLIIGVIFGGSLNTYFSKPYNYTFHDFIGSTGISGIDYWIPSKVGDIYVTEDFFIRTNGLNDFLITYNENGITSSSNLFPNNLFIPTLFNPFYGVGEFASTAITKGMSQEYCWDLGRNIIVVTDFQTLTPVAGYSPIAQAPGFVEVPLLSWFHIGLKDGAWMWTAVLLQPYVTMVTYLLIGKSLHIARDRS